MPNQDPLDHLLSRYTPAVPGAPTATSPRHVAPPLTVDGHRAASTFLRAIAAMHAPANAQLLIGLANYHLQQAAEKS